MVQAQRKKIKKRWKGRVSDQGQKRFISVQELAERWDCHVMSIERRIRTDPNFPKTFRFMRHRRFDLSDVEAHERKSVVAGREKRHAES